MKMKFTSYSIVLAIALSGCTSTPSRFTNDSTIQTNCGYVAEPIGTKGIDLEVVSKSYSFMPNPEDSVQEARNCFKKTATALAKRQSKDLQPISNSDMSASPTRNILTGHYTVYVTGKVYFSAN